MHIMSYLKYVKVGEENISLSLVPWLLGFLLPPKTITLRFLEYSPHDSFSTRWLYTSLTHWPWRLQVVLSHVLTGVIPRLLFWISHHPLFLLLSWFLYPLLVTPFLALSISEDAPTFMKATIAPLLCSLFFSPQPRKWHKMWNYFMDEKRELQWNKKVTEPILKDLSVISSGNALCEL